MQYGNVLQPVIYACDNPMDMFTPDNKDVPRSKSSTSHQVLFLGPMVQSAMDIPEGLTGDLQSALSELNRLHFNVMLKVGPA